jgi:hypothetical protein
VSIRCPCYKTKVWCSVQCVYRDQIKCFADIHALRASSPFTPRCVYHQLRARPTAMKRCGFCASAALFSAGSRQYTATSGELWSVTKHMSKDIDDGGGVSPKSSFPAYKEHALHSNRSSIELTISWRLKIFQQAT